MTRPERIKVLLLACPLGVLLLVRALWFAPVRVDGVSMEPTLLDGDRVLVSLSAFALTPPWSRRPLVSFGSPQPGDVILIRRGGQRSLIKRVVARAGDRIAIREGRVVLNGQPLPQQDGGPCRHGRGAAAAAGAPNTCRVAIEQLGTHRFATSSSSPPVTLPEQRVPQGQLYVLGDHRDHSTDSREPSFGTVPMEEVAGRVVLILGSFGDDGPRLDRALWLVR